MYICNTNKKFNEFRDFVTKGNTDFYIYSVFNIKH